MWTAADGMVDLGTLGGNEAYALAVNNPGEVVGYSYTAAHDLHAFYWSFSTGMVDIGVARGSVDINDNGGVAVTAADPNPNGASHAYLWTQTGGLTDLGTLGQPFSSAAEY